MNNEKLTAAELDELWALFNDTSPGKWLAGRYTVNCDGVHICTANSVPETEWIAEVHNTMPALLAMARRALALEEDNVRLKGLLFNATNALNPEADSEPPDDRWRG